MFDPLFLYPTAARIPYLCGLKLTIMSVAKEGPKKITTHVLSEMKMKGEKIAMLTAYDYSMAKLVDKAGLDVVLVGDSAANVMAGWETTLPITLDQMIYHAASVVRGVKRAMVVADLPFGSYQGNSKEAVASAIRMMKESGADALKLEGGKEIVESIERILSAGIPVMGHRRFCHCTGKNTGQTGRKGSQRTDHSRYWHWCRRGRGRTGTGGARHAGHQSGIFTPLFKEVPQLIRRNSWCRRQLHRRRKVE